MKQYGLIGFPLSHSFSKHFFTEKFNAEKIDASYELFPIENIQQLKNIVLNTDLQGLNVTIPYKEQVIPFLNEIDETALAVGAINVIKFVREGDLLKLVGYNSDVYGFETSIKPFLKKHHNKALILGTGGASKAIKYVLDKLGIESVFVSRTPAVGRLVYEDLNKDILNEYTIIINASPVGTYPKIDKCPQIPYQFVSEKHLLYDVVYNPAETLFLKQGVKQHATVVNGESMLVGQALAAWEIWNK